MIAEAVLIAEGSSTKKESRAKSAAPYLLTDTPPQNHTPNIPVSGTLTHEFYKFNLIFGASKLP
jgi:hypothetical protein